MKFSGFNTTEKVGIGFAGTSLPDQTLVVKASLPVVALESSNNQSRIDFRDGSTIQATIGLNPTHGDSFNIALGGSLTSDVKLLVKPDGKVGIGTTAPYGQLHVNASNYGESPTINKALLVSDSADVTKYLILTYHASVDVGIIQGLDDSLAWKNVAINPNGGSVGIGTTSPSVGLEVAKTSADASFKVNRTDQTNIQLIAAGSSYVRASAALILQSNGANNRLTLAADGSSTFSGNVLVNGTGTFSTAVAVGNAYIYTNYIRSSNLRVTDNGYLGSQSVPSVIQIQGDGDVAIGYPTTINSSLKATTILDASNSAGTNGQVLTSTGSALDWKTLSEISGVDGSGTANYIPKWTDSDTIGNSSIHEAGAGSLQIEGPSAGRFLTLNAPTTGGYITFETADTAFADIGTAKAISGNAAYSTTDLMINTRSGTKNIVFGMNGVEKVRIDNNGKVGIGTTNPGGKLEVDGSSVTVPLLVKAGTGANSIKFVGRSTDNISSLDFFQNNGSSGGGFFQSNGTWMRVRADGGVHFRNGNTPVTTSSDFTINGMSLGIGTTAPAALLQVGASGTGGGGVKIYGATNGNPLVMYEDTNNAITHNFHLDVSDNAGLIMYAASAVPKVSIQTSGNSYFIGGKVGIGTTAPGAPLEVVGGSTNNNDTANVLALTGSEHIRAIIDTSSTAGHQASLVLESNSNEVSIATTGSNEMRFNAGGSERVRINSNGNVGINVTDPDARLEIKGTGATTGLTFKTTDSVGNASFWIKDGGRVGVHYFPFVVNQDSTDTACPPNTLMYVHSASPFTIKTDGNVGIGETAPAHKLSIGDVAAIHLGYNGTSANHEVGRITSNTYNVDNSAYSLAEMDFMTSSANGYTGSIQFRTNSVNSTNTRAAVRMTILSDGKVGIGNENPFYPLHVQGATGFNGEAKNNALLFDTASATTGTGGGLAFGGYSNGTGGDIYHFGNIQGIKENSTAGNYASAMLFSTRANGATPLVRMRITSSGRVGIGTTSPSAKLDVFSPAGTGVALAVKGGNNLVDNILLNLINQSGTTVLNVRNNGALYGTAATFSGRIVGNDFEMLDSSGTGRTLVVRHSGNQVQFGDGSTFSIFRFNGTQVIPHADSTATLGTNALRWSTIYGDAGNFSEVMNLSGVNKIHQLSGHNFLQGDATMTYLYGGSGGGQIRTANNASSLIQWLDNGKVGIGNTSPDFKLEVGNAGGTLNTEFRIVGEKAISAAVSGISTYLWADGTTHGLNAWNYAGGAHPDLYIGWAGKNVLLNALGAGGKVGINTVSPSGLIHLKQLAADHYGEVIEASGNDAWIRMGHNGTYGAIHTTYHSSAGATPLILGNQNNMTTQLVLATNNNVGIGTAAPGAKLDIVGNSNTIPALKIGANATHGFCFYERSTEGDLRISKKVSGTEVDVLNIARSDGDVGFYNNVGIGIAAPGAKLDVVGGAVHISPDTAGKDTIRLTTNAANDGRILIKSDTTTKVDIQANGNTYFNGGDVGIGTTSPNSATNKKTLEINATWGGVIENSVSGTVKSRWDWSTGGITQFGTYVNEPLHLITNSAMAVTILANGNVGIGINAPIKLFHVKKSVNGDFIASIHNTNAAGWGTFMQGGGDSSDYSLLVRNQASSDLFSIMGDGEIRVAGQTLVDNANTNYKMTFPDNSGIAMGSAYTFANVYGSGGNLYLKANAYGANLGNNPSKIYLVTAGNSGSSAPDVVVKGGKVGIGTDAPSSPLQVTIPASQGLTDFGGVTFQETANRRGLSMGWDNSSGYFWFYSRDVGVASRGINLNNALYVKSLGGNVGIGVTAPGAKLHVTGAPGNSTYLSYLFNSATHSEANGLNVQIASSGSSAMGLRVNTGGDSNAFIVAGDGDTGLGFTPSNFAQKLNVNGGAYINGFVGIGTATTMSSSAELLGVYSASNGHASFKNSSDSTGTVYIRNVSTTASTWQPYLILADSGGNRGGLALKYSTAGLKVHGQGGIEFWTGSSFGAGTLKMTIASNGFLTVAGDASIGSAATKLKTYSDSTYSGIYNGSSLASDEAIYFGAGTTYFKNNGATSLVITSASRVQLQATDFQLQYQSGSHIWFTRLQSNGTFAIHKNGVSDFLSIGSTGTVSVSSNFIIPQGNLLYLDGGSNTYIYSDTADSIALATGGSVRMTINSNGTVFMPNGKAFAFKSSSGVIQSVLSLNSSNAMVLGGTGMATNAYPIRNIAKYITFEPAGGLGVGIETMRITNSSFAGVGSVGIGTTTPATLLNVYSAIANANGIAYVKQAVATNNPTLVVEQTVSGGNANVNQGLVVRAVGTGDGSGNTLHVYRRDNSTTGLVVKGSGNVGIGTVIAPNLLTLKGDSKYLAMYASDGSEAVRLGVDSSGDGQLRLMDGGGNTRIFFYGESGANSYINNGGKVGIGTTAPAAELQINGSHTSVNENAPYGTNSTHLNLKNTSDTDGNLVGVLFEGAVGAAYMGGMYMEMENHSSFHSKLHFATRNAGSFGSKMTLTKDGKVGIGTVSPGKALEVIAAADHDGIEIGSSSGHVRVIDFTRTPNSANPTARIQVMEPGATHTSDMRFYTSDAVGGPNLQERMIIDSDGSVGIGTNNPGTLLHVNGAMQSKTLSVLGDGTSLPFLSTSGGNNMGTFFSTLTTYARLRINIAAGGDSQLSFMSDSTSKWSIGNDGGDSHKFKIKVGFGEFSGAEKFMIQADGNIGIGTNAAGYKFHVQGDILASGSIMGNSKSFVIDHPTKPNNKLQYGALEGPEFGVYHRGRAQSNTITLPDYWTALVREETITVQLTPKGSFQHLYVVSQSLTEIVIGAADGETIDCFYTIYAERADIDRLEVEKEV